MTQEIDATTFADFDHLDHSRTASQTRQLWTEMRDRCPVAHSDNYGGYYVINRYAEVRDVLTSSDGFSSADGISIPPTGLPRAPALEFEGAAHAMWRSLMAPPLTPRAVRQLEATIAEVADNLIDEFAAAGSADLVEQLAEPMPAIVIGRMIGLDEERSRQGRVVGSALYEAQSNPDRRDDALAAFRVFIDAQLDERRVTPREDFLTQIASGEVDGVAIDSDGAFGLMLAYILGGHHSTGSGIAGLLHHVLTVPGLRDRLQADPKLIGPAIEESLRLNTPLQLFARSACEAAQAGQIEFESGSRVLVNLAAANRDPLQFEDAEQFHLDRSRNPHVAFGAGKHVCIGQALARAELRIALSRLLERLPDLQLAQQPRELVIGKGLMMMESLEVSFTPERR